MPTSTKQEKTASKTLKSAEKVAVQTADEAVGKPIPAFSLPATRIGKVSSSVLKGKPFVLYFYPKDDTSGCTAEACGFRDTLPAFTKLGITVIGVSKDDLESHEKFAKKYGLAFPLASDTDGTLCEKLDVWKQKSMYGRTYMGIERSTFLVDGAGVVRAVWRKVSVTGHVDEVMKAITEL